MMRIEIRKLRVLGGLLIAAATLCCAPAEEAAAPEAAPAAAVTEAPVDLAAEEQAALQVNRDWLEKARAKNSAGIGELFVEEAWRLTEDGVTEGRPAIVAALQQDMDENPGAFEDWGSKEIWVAGSGELAVERGWYKNDPDGDGEAPSIDGEYVTVLVKRDGAWKVLTDVSVPAGGIAAQSGAGAEG
jgi:ketosteroid isomerase-like protein